MKTQNDAEVPEGDRDTAKLLLNQPPGGGGGVGNSCDGDSSAPQYFAKARGASAGRS